jgi:hypothetical protein
VVKLRIRLSAAREGVVFLLRPWTGGTRCWRILILVRVLSGGGIVEDLVYS